MREGKGMHEPEIQNKQGKDTWKGRESKAMNQVVRNESTKDQT